MASEEQRWHNFSMHSHPTTQEEEEEEEERRTIAKEEPWLSISAPPPDVHIRVHGVTFHLNKRCMASRSAKLADLLESNQHINLTTNSFTDIPADPRTFELAARFCYGHEPDLSADTAIPLACVASYLEMTEDHSPNNLLNKILTFIANRILPHWNETIKAFRSIRSILPQAQHLGLVHACLKSISEKAATDPNFLGDPIVISEGAMITANAGVRRRLFVVDRSVEDLTSLPLPLYELAMSAIMCSSIPPEHLAQCVYRYARRWVDHMAAPAGGMEVEVSVYDKINQREVIEVVEKLMPNKRGAIHIKCLFELLRSAVFLQVSQKCRNGFEARIGKQLPEASADDLCIPSYGYAKETKYDMKCVIRILNHFSSNSLSELEAVSEIVEDFLAAAATDENLRKEELVTILEILVTMIEPIGRCHDGVYRAIDMYLDAHGFLTETEREEICRVLDVGRMSVEASEHASRSERLPLRAVAQVLFVGQLRIREAIAELREEEEEEEEEGVVRKEMVRMDGRVSELESECVRMRREIERCGERGREEGRGLWKEVRDVFGCKSAELVECNCHVKKKKKKVYPKIGGA